MRYLALAIVFVAVGSCNVQAENCGAVGSRPDWAACIKRQPPVPKQPATWDHGEYYRLKAELDRDLAAVEYRARSADYGLRYQLDRAQFCNSIRQDGC